jgi:4-hydroxybenzoyl-CoA reductase subunit beta
MRLPKFEYLEPNSIDEVLKVLSETKGDATILAGGTDILPSMKRKSVKPKYVVGLKKLSDTRYIKYKKGDGLTIGGITTLREIIESEVIKDRYPIIIDACSRVASNQIRNVGTIGGNICLDNKCMYYNQDHIWWKSREDCFKRGGKQCYVVKRGKSCWALSMADTVPALIALDARIKLINSSGEREIKLEDFYTGEGRSVNNIKEDEILIEIIIPEGNGISLFKKLAVRGAIDFAIVNTGVKMSMSDGRCKDIRIVVNAVSPSPERLRNTEEFLKDKKLDDVTIEEASDKATKEIKYVTDMFGNSSWYRRRMIKVLISRSIKEIAGRR